MYWDEGNRLMVLSDIGKTSRFTYNAAGERVAKSHGDLEGVYVNGAPQGITFWLSPTSVQAKCKTNELALHSACTEVPRDGGYTFYPAPIIIVVKNRFTKHYLLMLATLGVAYAIGVNGRAFVALNHFCLLQNINNKYKNT